MAGHTKTRGHQRHLTIVIKLGTSSIVDEKTHEPLLSILTLIVETAVKLHKDGHKVIIVSSGAIGVGLRRMDMEKRPKHLPQVQVLVNNALAAIGQCRLMNLWDSLFTHLHQPIAQILLTRNDIADRTQYLNAHNTLFELLHLGVIPIVNENDTLAVSEIKFGDNDTLSAITAAMVQADYLFLMTDVDCLYTANPRTNPDARPIEVVEDISALVADVSSAGSALGTGGMSTKIVAARLATSAGVTTVITRSSNPGNIVNIVNYLQETKNHTPTSENGSCTPGTPSTSAIPSTAADLSSLTLSATLPQKKLPPPPLHTRFLPDLHPIRDRYFWLLHGLTPHGIIYIDEGAYLALSNKAGLLPVGVVFVSGHFSQQEAVRLFVVPRLNIADANQPNAELFEKMDPPPVEVGRALVNYSAGEILRIKGLRSHEIEGALGYADSEYVALRENIAFIPEKDRSSRAGTPPVPVSGMEEVGTVKVIAAQV
ncbi:MAG: hypothetical protein M1834_002404 [Cirrosporium novae-zelandiae]|nr:MAG: hypothetical protein M1834_002404 [Cirrosporium novae-zelandiae]